jgi:hypothetical protein
MYKITVYYQTEKKGIYSKTVETTETMTGIYYKSMSIIRKLFNNLSNDLFNYNPNPKLSEWNEYHSNLLLDSYLSMIRIFIDMLNNCNIEGNIKRTMIYKVEEIKYNIHNQIMSSKLIRYFDA